MPGMPTDWEPYSARLRSELEGLAALSDKLLDASSIEYRGDDNRGPYVTLIAPDWAWAKATDQLRRMQMDLVPKYDAWFERYNFLFKDAPDELRQLISEAHTAIRPWLARDGTDWGWDVPHTIAEAKAIQLERFAKLPKYLEVVAPEGASGGVLAIPDTSALMNAPDLTRYPAALGVTELDLYLVPGVLSELDDQKDRGRTPAARDRARAAGKAINDVRKAGTLLDGIEIQQGVRLFSRPQEPDFAALPGHLDPLVPDDRILAAAFELQRAHPTSAVVLVTADLNLQTKAELARLPFAEPPEMITP
jgi:hypothetical protein